MANSDQEESIYSFDHQLIESAPDAMVIIDQSAKIAIVNSQTERVFGYQRDELIGQQLEMLMPERYRSRHVGLRDGYRGNPVHRPMGSDLQLYGLRKNGEEFPIEISLGPLVTDGGTWVSSSIRDVTERREVEAALRISLKEKEVLIQEVHHRVKNNLQAISSLLGLQARKVQDQKTKDILEENCSRVRSFALLHEHLYRSKNLADINLSQYISDILESLAIVPNQADRKIEVQQEIEEIELDIDTTINCGLIITELVTNSLKHAFEDRNDGCISVSMKKEGEKGVVLIVSDDGCGCNDYGNQEGSESLGLKLVEMFTREIGGTIERLGDKGTIVNIKFNRE